MVCQECAGQEQIYSVSYKITTDDKFLQNMMLSVDALPARTEPNLESIKGQRHSRLLDMGENSTLAHRLTLHTVSMPASVMSAVA